jgi:hypothetical protein
MENFESQQQCIFCGVPLMGTEAERDKPQVCVMCTAPCDHLPLETGEMMKTKVLVEVENGVTTTSTIGDVEVLVVDYDVLGSGESLLIPEAFYDAFAGLREAVSARVEEEKVTDEGNVTPAR